jgi:hypothetical protein
MAMWRSGVVEPGRRRELLFTWRQRSLPACGRWTGIGHDRVYVEAAGSGL